MEIRTVDTEHILEKRSEKDEDEEEALSLSDLPVDLNKDNHHHNSTGSEIQENKQDFDFELFGGSISSTSQMCSADDIFFKGQILPFRTSENSNPKSGCLSRSESSTERFSSRSSSSSSSTGNSSSRVSRPRIQNQFFSTTHSSSSPNPQIRIPNSSTGNRHHRKSSTVWEFFRLSLVHNPEIELQDLKARNSVSRNSSTSSSSNSNNTNISSRRRTKQGKQRKQIMLLSGCSNCTVNSVKPVPYIKINNQEIEEIKKQEQLEIIKNKKKKHRGKEKVSNHRTFEWIKELSNPSFLDEEEGNRVISLGS